MKKHLPIIFIIASIFLINTGISFASNETTNSTTNTALNISYSPSYIEYGSNVTFFARYTDNAPIRTYLATGVCNINIDAGGYAEMTFSPTYHTYLIPLLSVGAHTYTVNCTNEGGNSNMSLSEAFTVIVSAPPTLTITSPINNGNYTNRIVNLNFSTSDPSGLSSCKYSKNDAAPTTINCYQNTTIDFGSDGTYSIVFNSTDILGNINSTTISNIVIDTTPPIVPIIWNFSRSVNTSPINVIGYVNEANANITVASYNQATSISYGINSSTSGSIGSLIGMFDVISNNNIGDTTIRLNDTTNVVAGRFIEIQGKTPKYFIRYNITAVDTITNIITLQTGLTDNITSGQKALIYSTQKYDGWFNISLILNPDTDNLVEIKSKDLYGNIQSIANTFNIFYQTQPPRFDLSRIRNVTGQNITLFDFNVLDNVTVNLSTLLINITNSSGNSTYYMHQSYNGNLTNSKNITCLNQGTSNVSCSIDANFTNGYYNITFSVSNLVSLTNTTRITNYLADLNDPTSPFNVTLGAFSTNNNYLNLTWNLSNATSGIAYYEYAIGNLTSFNSTYGWNATNFTNIYLGPLNLTSNKVYYAYIRAVSNANRTSNITYSSILFFDGTGPIVYNVTQLKKYSSDKNTLSVSWSAYDNESTITGFDIIVTKKESYPWQNDSNIVSQTQVSGNDRYADIIFNGANALLDNTTYYVSIYGINDMNIKSNVPGNSGNNATTIDLTGPENLSISYLTGRIANNNLTIAINPGYDDISGIKKYTIEKSETNYVNGICQGVSFISLYEKNVSDVSNIDKHPVTENVLFTLTNGKCYSFRLIVENHAGLTKTAYNSISASPIDENTSIDITPPSSFNIYDTLNSKDNQGLMTLSGDSLTATFDKPYDAESGISYYELWVTEQAYGSSESQFSPHTSSNPLKLIPDNFTNYAITPVLEYTLTNLNLNLSNQSDPTHQYKYRVYVKAFNGNNLSTPSNTDGIIYIDNVQPTPTVLWVENETINKTPYYDYVENNFTTVQILGEIGISCQWSRLDQGFKEPMNNATNCTLPNAQNQVTCFINETISGIYYYHISCKDSNGNFNTAIDNLDLTITTDLDAPLINLTSPNKNLYSNNSIILNYTVFDFSNITSWVIMNSSVRNETLIQTPNYLGNQISVLGRIITLDNSYTNYTLTVFANDSNGQINSTSTWFIYDNSTPTLNINIPTAIYNNSFNTTFAGSFTRNISWNVTRTDNLSLKILNGTINNQNYTSFNISQFINLSGQDDGNYTINVFYINDIGRNSTKNTTFVYDNTAPIIHLPIFYMNETKVKDFMMKINDTINVFEHNFTIKGYDSFNITVNVDNATDYLLYYEDESKVNFDNIIIENIHTYNIYSGNNNYKNSIFIISISNSTYNQTLNFNKNSLMQYTDLSNNQLYTNYLNLTFSIEDLTNITNVNYDIYYQGNPIATINPNTLLEKIILNDNLTSYNINLNLSQKQEINSNQNFTIKISAKDIFGKESIDYYNFTYIKFTPTLPKVNITNNTKFVSENNLYFFTNSNFSINATCNNSDKSILEMYDLSTLDLIYKKADFGNGIINLNENINSSFENGKKYSLSILCVDQINSYDYKTYNFTYDNSSPIIQLFKPLIETNSEYYLKESIDTLFENLTIRVENITQTDGTFKINDHAYQTIAIGENKSFFNGMYEITLLVSYPNIINKNYSYVSFRLKKSGGIDKSYPQESSNFMIDANGKYFFKRNIINFYFKVSDYSDIFPYYAIGNTIVSTYNSSGYVYNAIQKHDIPTKQQIYNNLSSPIDYIIIDFSDPKYEIGKEYRINISSKDQFNQESIEIFNFSIYNANPNFTYYGTPSTIQMLNKEDNIQLLNAYDTESLTYGIESISDKINATLIDFNNKTYMKINSTNESYVGNAWITINATDAFGGYDKYNYTINISDSIGPIIFNINSTENIVINYYYNTTDNLTTFDSMHTIRSYMDEIYFVNSSVKTAIPVNIYGINISTQNISLIIGRDNKEGIIIKNVNFTSNNTFNVTYEVYNRSLINQTLFSNENQDIKDAFILKIDSNAFNGNYTIIWNYNQFNISTYNATNFLNISKLDINSSYGINYSSIIMGQNKKIDITNWISSNFQNFSLFVLAIEKPTAEICGDGIDQNQNGINDSQEVDCQPVITPPSNGGTSSSGGSSTPKVTSVNGGGIPRESCTDTLKNQDETNIDCGGICGGYFYDNSCHTTPKATCFDNIINQNEIGVDCGGACNKQCIIETPGTISENLGENTDKQENNNDIITNETDISENKRILSILKANSIWFMGIIGIIILGISGLGFALSRRKTSNFDYGTPSNIDITPAINTGEMFTINKEETNLDSDEFSKIISYVNAEQAKGTPNSKIKINLLNSNWPEKMIDKAFEKTECSLRLKELSNYIKKARAHGHSDENIRYHLIKAEWAEHFIDMVMHDVHVIHDDFEKVKKYTKTMLEKGYSKEDVLKTLVDIGWQKEDVYSCIVGTD